jgi:NAD+ synthase (glutamine-hydrolysing)
MPRIRLAAAALNQTPLAWNTNRQHIVAALDAARQTGVGVLCLPELAISGYGCEDMFLSAGVRQTALELLSELLPETRGLFTCLGLPIEFEGHIYNAVAVACDRRLLGFVAKQHLAGDGIHYEPRWFAPWLAEVVDEFTCNGQSVPVGDLLFACGEVGIGFEICRDAWGQVRPAERLAKRGADVILNPSASHFAFGKQAIREAFTLRATRNLGVHFVYTNLLGNEAGRAIYDGGSLLATGGEIVARGPRFSLADVTMTSLVVDVEPRGIANDPTAHVAATLTFPNLNDAVNGETTTTAYVVDEQGTSIAIGAPPSHPSWEAGPRVKEEELARAVPLALLDYARKSRTRGFVVSLSGGADSAVTAVMVHLAVQLGVTELGPARFLEKLGLGGLVGDMRDANSEPTAEQIVHRLLACIYQSTANSGDATRQAARTVAESIGAEFFEWSVEQPVADYRAMVSAAVGRELSWETDDIALQNIQARARGPGAWLLANLRGALLLATSNRSEAAVGYATMDGDTCGGLAPIAGIDKAFLREWLRWMEHTGPAGLAPLSSLSVVNELAPTAELRPPSAAQTDESDLMPYRILDAIERAAIRDRLMPLEVWQVVAPQFPDIEAKQLAEWVERFFRLWCRNQWKRERYAPSFHLDDENLDPKSWCRFPILSGGFERELAELREVVAKER